MIKIIKNSLSTFYKGISDLLNGILLGLSYLFAIGFLFYLIMIGLIEVNDIVNFFPGLYNNY